MTLAQLDALIRQEVALSAPAASPTATVSDARDLAAMKFG